MNLLLLVLVLVLLLVLLVYVYVCAFDLEVSLFPVAVECLFSLTLLLINDPPTWPSSFARNMFRYATGDIRGALFPAFFFLQGQGGYSEQALDWR